MNQAKKLQNPVPLNNTTDVILPQANLGGTETRPKAGTTHAKTYLMDEVAQIFLLLLQLVSFTADSDLL